VLVGWRPGTAAIWWVCPERAWWSSYLASLQIGGLVGLWGRGPAEWRLCRSASLEPAKAVASGSAECGPGGPAGQGPKEWKPGGGLVCLRDRGPEE
jgi:hypothetical protein